MRLLAAALVVTAVAGGGAPAACATAACRARCTPRRHCRTDGCSLAGGCVDPGCESATATTELYDPARRRFVRGPRLSRPRVGHAALLLRDGSVLVLGGWSGGVPTATAERLVGGRFVATGPMLSPRGGFTATRLRDGRVLVVGGTSGSETLASAELYDPAIGPVRRDRQPREVAQRPHRDAASRRPGARRRAARTASTSSGRPRSTTRRPVVSRRRARCARLDTSTRPSSSVTVACSSSAARTCATSAAATARPSCGARPRAASRRRRRSASPGSSFPTPSSRLPSGDVVVAGGGEYGRAPTPGRPLRAGGRGRRAVHVRDRDRRCRAGSVLVAGGYDESITPTAGAWLYRSG